MLRFVSRRFWRDTTREQEKGTSLLGSDVPSSLLTPVALPRQGAEGGARPPQACFRQPHRKLPCSSTSTLAGLPAGPTALPGAVSQQVPLVPQWVMIPGLPTQPGTPRRISMPVTGLGSYLVSLGGGDAPVCFLLRVSPRPLLLHAIPILFRVHLNPSGIHSFCVVS